MPTADNKRLESAERRRKNRRQGENRPYPRVWARPVIAGRTCMITMKTHQGRLFLNPGADHEETTNFFGYALEPPRAYQMRFEAARGVAGTSRWEIAAGLARDRAWEKQYAVARGQYAGGDKHGVFPMGTYFMRRRAHVSAATGPP